ncbi:MAG: biotin/lipoyl-containing protein [Bacteroidales bacterium]
MAVEIKIPSPGESISEVELASWFVEDGSLVHKNQEVGEIESEKATLPLIAEKAGRIRLMAAAGDTVRVGTVVAQIDTSVDVPQSTGDDSPAAETKPAPSVPAPPVEEPAPAARIKRLRPGR